MLFPPAGGYGDDFSNFGSLKSTETERLRIEKRIRVEFQQFRLVEEH